MTSSGSSSLMNQAATSSLCFLVQRGNWETTQSLYSLPNRLPSSLARKSLAKNITESLSQLILCLLSRVHPRRVFSVFSIATVAEKFAKIFEEHTHQEYNITACKDPYYDATFTFCTKNTLNDASASFNSISESDGIHIALCLADDSHLEGVKALCKGFSTVSAVSITYVVYDL